MYLLLTMKLSVDAAYYHINYLHYVDYFLVTWGVMYLQYIVFAWTLQKWQKKWFRAHDNGDLHYYDSEKVYTHTHTTAAVHKYIVEWRKSAI